MQTQRIVFVFEESADPPPFAALPGFLSILPLEDRDQFVVAPLLVCDASPLQLCPELDEGDAVIIVIIIIVIVIIIIIIITIITDLKEDPVNPKTQTLTSPQKRKSLDFFRKQADGIALGAGGERVRAENKGRLKISFVTCLAGLLHESAR